MRMHDSKTASYVWFPSARPPEPETCELKMDKGPARVCAIEAREGDEKVDAYGVSRPWLRK